MPDAEGSSWSRGTREPGLVGLLRDTKSDDRASYRWFNGVEELERLVVDDLSLLLSEQFEAARAHVRCRHIRPTSRDR